MIQNNITTTSGEELCLELEVRNKQLKKGDTVTMTIRKNQQGGVYVQKVVKIDEDTNKVVFTLEPHETDRLHGYFIYDVRLRTKQARIITLIMCSRIYFKRDTKRKPFYVRPEGF